MDDLLESIAQCEVCQPHLDHQVRPVVSAHQNSKIAIIGQAPGRKVHESGIPWDDKSGERLRQWLDVSNYEFYNPELFAIIPMGFCYPGKGKTGDLPPRKECAPLWHKQLFDGISDMKMLILIGSYAQNYYLGKQKKRTLTDTVKAYKEYLPTFLPIPHPSPRNNIWLKKNEWFESELIPEIQEFIRREINKINLM